MKKIIIGSLLAVGLASGIAYAHGNNWNGHMMGYGNSGYGMMGGGMMGGRTYDCPGATWSGQTGANAEVNQKYLDQTSEFRKKMHDLHFDYMEAYRNPTTTQENLANMQQQMDDLRKQMFEISKGLRTE